MALGWRISSELAAEGDAKPISFVVKKNREAYDPRVLHEEMILIHLASSIAEQRAYGSFSDQASKKPLASAQEVADAAALGDARAFLPEVLQLISFYWRTIEALAGRILRMKEGEALTEDELKSIFIQQRPSRAERRAFERKFGNVRQARYSAPDQREMDP
jgi:hypothetical protein